MNVKNDTDTIHTIPKSSITHHSSLKKLSMKSKSSSKKNTANLPSSKNANNTNNNNAFQQNATQNIKKINKTYAIRNFPKQYFNNV